MNDTWLLTLIIFLPALWAGVLLMLPRTSDGFNRWTSLLIVGATCGLTFVLFGRFLDMIPDVGAMAPLVDRAMQTGTNEAKDLVVRYNWITTESFKIEYYLGVDGISMSLVLLTSIVSFLAMLASFSIEKYVRGYCILFLLLVTGMMGTFLALDFFLFYVFWEVMLLPMYFLIGIWGGPRREYAAIKFFLYTLFGSVLILIAMLGFYFYSDPNTFDIMRLHAIGQDRSMLFSSAFQITMFILLFIGFAIKIPVVPLHTWLPDAHVEAPTPISMILAGVLLKMGGYGLIRIAYPICPAGAAALAFPLAIIGVGSILYGAFAAMAQTDFKKLVAYSSVSHMGYVTVGIAVMGLTLGGDPAQANSAYYTWGMAGAMYQMLAHGVSSAGMFFLVGVIYERAHHRDLNRFGGLMNIMPVYGAISIIIFFAGMGLPGLCGFIGELFTVLATFYYSPTLGVLAAFGVVLTAGYILWTIQRVYLGGNKDYEGTPEIKWWPERITIIPLIVLAVVLGIYPNIVLDWMGPDVEHLVRSLTSYVSDQSTTATAGM